MFCVCFLFFFFKQKTAYEMRISDWSSDVCSSDLVGKKPWFRLNTFTDQCGKATSDQQVGEDGIITEEPDNRFRNGKCAVFQHQDKLQNDRRPGQKGAGDRHR